MQKQFLLFSLLFYFTSVHIFSCSNRITQANISPNHLKLACHSFATQCRNDHFPLQNHRMATFHSQSWIKMKKPELYVLWNKLKIICVVVYKHTISSVRSPLVLVNCSGFLAYLVWLHPLFVNVYCVSINSFHKISNLLICYLNTLSMIITSVTVLLALSKWLKYWQQNI